jgi:hypothetical protein
MVKAPVLTVGFDDVVYQNRKKKILSLGLYCKVEVDTEKRKGERQVQKNGVWWEEKVGTNADPGLSAQLRGERRLQHWGGGGERGGVEAFPCQRII